VFARTLGCILLLAALPAICGGQTTPQLSKIPGATDTKLSGTAQGPTAQYDSVSLYVCAAATLDPPLDCSADDAKTGRRQKLVNLDVAPFVVNSPDGIFTISLSSSLPPRSYLWIVQVTRSHTDHSVLVKTSTPVRIPVPFIYGVTISLSGYDSASRDVGGTAILDFGHGMPNDRLGQTQFVIDGTYDNKWKNTPNSSNVTQNYSATLAQLKELGPATALGPYAIAYHNNTQGIRVEQTYGAGITQRFRLSDLDSLTLRGGMQAMLEDLYSPGISTNLGGLHLSGELNHSFRNGSSVDVMTGATPVFTQDRAWSASGDFSLNVPLNPHWSMKFDVLDNYDEIAPKTFNKNYLRPSIGISFK